MKNKPAALSNQAAVQSVNRREGEGERDPCRLLPEELACLIPLIRWMKIAGPAPEVDRRPAGRPFDPGGFALTEALIALAVLCFGLLAAGQLICLALNAATLSRAKGAAVVLAGSRLEALSDVFEHRPDAPELQPGSYGPEIVEVISPETGAILNRFALVWQIAPAVDPRTGTPGRAREVTLTARPVDPGGDGNIRSWQNKEVTVCGIFSHRER